MALGSYMKNESWKHKFDLFAVAKALSLGSNLKGIYFFWCLISWLKFTLILSLLLQVNKI